MLVWAKLTGEAVNWASWLWQNRGSMGDAFERLGLGKDFAQSAINNATGAVRRVGNTLVFGHADGGPRVLAYIEQTGPQIKAIEQAVHGIQAQNLALSASLSSLQTLSMVSLGLIALTPVVLTAQLRALGARLKEMGKEIADIKDMIEVRNEADLSTGLNSLEDAHQLLRQGKEANTRLHDALDHCKESMFFFSGLLGRELQAKSARRRVVGFLNRQCAVALCGTVSCHVALGEDSRALEQIDTLLPGLRAGTQWLFERTAGGEPERFLEPGLIEYKIDLTFLTELFNQARFAGAVKSSEMYTEASLFDEWRPRMHRVGRRSFKLQRWHVAELLADLREAMASVEETNRVLGLQAMIEEMRRRGCPTFELMQQVRDRAVKESAETCPFVVWAAQ